MYKENFTTRKAVQAIFLSILIIIFAQAISRWVYKLPISMWLKAVIFGVLYIAIAYGMIKLLCNKMLNISLEECHIKKPKFSILWIILSLMLPLLVSGILLYTPGELVKNNMNNKQIINIVVSAIFTSAIVHGIWNIAMIGKILNIGIVHDKNAIFSYKIQAKSVILTGGAFGVESSIVAVFGYILVIVFTLVLMKRKSTNL